MGKRRTEINNLTVAEDLELFKKDIAKFLKEIKSQNKKGTSNVISGDIYVKSPEGIFNLEIESIEELKELFRLNLKVD